MEDEYISKILEISKNNIFIRLRDIKKFFYFIFIISNSMSSISTILLKNKISFTKNYKQNSPCTEKELTKQEKNLRNKIKKFEIKNLKSIDKWVFILMRPIYAWTPKGKQKIKYLASNIQIKI